MKLKFQYSDHLNKVWNYCEFQLYLRIFCSITDYVLHIIDPSPEAIQYLFDYINENDFLVDLDDVPAVGDGH